LPPSEWERCKGWIADALPYADHSHTLDDIEAMLIQGRLWLYAGHRSAMVLEVVENPQWKALHVFLGGGDLEEIKAMLPRLDKVARELGCKKVGMTGRPGWARALQGLGYRMLAAVVEKELADEPE
jgi:hypothetical protein